jgi:Tfp pilus assembly protein PilO
VDRNRVMMFAAMGTAVVVLALGFLLGVQPQLSAATASRDQAAAVQAQNEQIRAAIAQLQADNDALPALRAELGTLQSAVPSTASISTFISEVSRLSGETDTTVTDITTADAEAYAPVAAAAPTDAAAEPTDGASETAAATEPALPTAPELVTDPAITAANFSVVPVSITVEGSYDAALDFVSALQGGSRLFSLETFGSSGADEAGSEGGAPDSWTLAGNVYVLLDAAATPTEAATTPTPQAEGPTESDTAAGE